MTSPQVHEPSGLRRSYGGPWQELRALIATRLLGWALSVHAQATIDMVRAIAREDNR